MRLKQSGALFPIDALERVGIRFTGIAHEAAERGLSATQGREIEIRQVIVDYLAGLARDHPLGDIDGRLEADLDRRLFEDIGANRRQVSREAIAHVGEWGGKQRAGGDFSGGDPLGDILEIEILTVGNDTNRILGGFAANEETGTGRRPRADLGKFG